MTADHTAYDVLTTAHIAFSLQVLSNGEHDLLMLAYLKIYTIELVKTSPSSRRCQPLEKLGHGQVVQGVTAVEDHTLPCQGFCQVLQALQTAILLVRPAHDGNHQACPSADAFNH